MTGQRLRRQDWILFTAVALAYMGVVSQFAYRGMSSDEDYFVNICRQILGGEVPYRDFRLIPVPLAFYLQSAIFRLFGLTYMVSRLSAAALGLVTLALIYALSRRFGRPAVAAVAACSFIFWGVPHLRHTWYSWYSIPLALGELLALFRFAEDGKKRFVIAAGVLAGLQFWTKQTLGPASLVVGIFVIALSAKWASRDLRHGQLVSRLAQFLGPVILIGAGGIGLLWKAGALEKAFDSIVKIPRQYAQAGGMGLFHIFPEQRAGALPSLVIVALIAVSLAVLRLVLRKRFTPGSAAAVVALAALPVLAILSPLARLQKYLPCIFSHISPSARLGEAILVFAPFLIGILALVFPARAALRGRNRVLLIEIAGATLVAVTYAYSSFLHTADLIHQIMALPTSLLLLAALLEPCLRDSAAPEGGNRGQLQAARWVVIGSAMASFCILGAEYAVEARGMSYTTLPLRLTRTPLGLPGVSAIQDTALRKLFFASIYAAVKQYTQPGDAIFTFPYERELYLVTDRPDPGLYDDNFNTPFKPEEMERDALTALSGPSIKLVVLQDANSDPWGTVRRFHRIVEAVKMNFMHAGTYGNFSVWVRKEPG